MTQTLPPNRSLKKIASRLVLALTALIITVLILGQAAVLGGVLWINGPGGQRWIERTIKQATGYTVSLGHVSFTGMRMIEADALSIADDRGAFLNADRVFIALDPPALLARRLDVSLRADHLILDRLPLKKAEKPQGGPLLAPFTVPDMFVRRINIDGLLVNHLTLGKDIAGQAMTLSPSLSLRIALGPQAIDFDAAATINAAAGLPASAPQNLTLKGRLDPRSATLSLDHLLVKGDGYQLTAAGQTGLGQGGVTAINYQGRIDDLARLAASMPGRIDFKGDLTGPADDPSATLQGTAQLSNLTARGLGDINAVIEAHHLIAKPEGAATVRTRYQNRDATLKSGFLLDGKSLTLRDMTGDAPELSLRGDIALNTATLQAVGDIQMKADLAAYQDLASLDIGGQFTGGLHLAVRDQAQAVALTSAITNLRYAALRARLLGIDAAMNDVRTLWPDQASIRVTNAQMPDLLIDRLAVTLAHQDQDFYDVKLSGQGRARKNFTLAGTARLTGKTAAAAALHDADITLLSGQGSLNIKGDLLPDRVALSMNGRDFPLNAVLASLDATLGGKAQLTGAPAAPVMQADLLIKPTRQIVRGAQLSVAARYQDKNINAALTGKGKGIRSLSGSIALPATLSLRPFVFAMPASTALKGALRADLDLGLLASFLPPDIVLTGDARAAIDAGGTIGKPAASGTAAVANAAFEQISSGIALRGIAARAAFKDNRLSLDSFRADDGKGGLMQGAGSIVLADQKADIRIGVKNLNPFRNNPFVTGPVSGDFTLTGAAANYLIKGTLQTGPMDITIPERFSSAIPRLNIVETKTAGKGNGQPLKTIALDIAIRASNRIFVRGWGLDAEFGGDLQAGGTLAAPQINGTLDSKRGRYEQFGKRFDITRGALRFQGTVPPSPYLDITAETQANDIKAIIALSGPINSPAIKLSSTPALPDDEVLSRVLFGKETANISPFQALQIAQTLRQFSGHGGGGLDPLGKLRSVTRLDDLEVNTSESGETTVGAGKYIGSKVYVSVESGADQKSSVGKLQIDVAPHVKVETKIGQEAQTGAGVLWQWDY